MQTQMNEVWESPETLKVFKDEARIRPRRKVIANIVAAKGYTSVLEVGCGVGNMYQCLKEQLALFPDYEGIDQSVQFILEARRRHAEGTFCTGDIEAEYYWDWKENFDVVIAEHVLEHLPSFELALVNMAFMAKRAMIIGWFLKPSEAEILGVEESHGHRYILNQYEREYFMRIATGLGFEYMHEFEIPGESDDNKAVWLLEKKR